MTKDELLMHKLGRQTDLTRQALEHPDLSTKPKTSDTSEKRVHESDTIVASDYSKQSPDKHWDTTDMAYRAGGLSMGQEPVTWRNAAIRLGEDLYSVGPNGYYDMTASQWLDWALSVVNTAPPKRKWVELTFEEADRLASKYSSGFRSDHNDALHLVGEVEALLKEKNT